MATIVEIARRLQDHPRLDCGRMSAPDFNEIVTFCADLVRETEAVARGELSHGLARIPYLEGRIEALDEEVKKNRVDLLHLQEKVCA